MSLIIGDSRLLQAARKATTSTSNDEPTNAARPNVDVGGEVTANVRDTAGLMAELVRISRAMEQHETLSAGLDGPRVCRLKRVELDLDFHDLYDLYVQSEWDEIKAFVDKISLGTGHHCRAHPQIFTDEVKELLLEFAA